MTEILEKSGNFMRGKKWEPCYNEGVNFQGPDDDQEEESELSVTELKEQREKQKREAEILQAERNKDDEEEREEDSGCSWGMGKGPFTPSVSVNVVSRQRCMRLGTQSHWPQRSCLGMGLQPILE